MPCTAARSQLLAEGIACRFASQHAHYVLSSPAAKLHHRLAERERHVRSQIRPRADHESLGNLRLPDHDIECRAINEPLSRAVTRSSLSEPKVLPVACAPVRIWSTAA